ncbi:MAG: cation transporter [Mariprofundaceae bacterium]
MRKIMLAALLLSIVSLYAHDVSAEEKTATLNLSGMTCGTCPISVRHHVMRMKGVHAAAADMKTATVTYEDSEQSSQAIADAISELGFPATVKEVKP